MSSVNSLSDKDLENLSPIVSLGLLLKKDPLQAVIFVRNNREKYSWISDDTLNSIENEIKTIRKDSE